MQLHITNIQAYISPVFQTTLGGNSLNAFSLKMQGSKSGILHTLIFYFDFQMVLIHEGSKLT